VVEANLSDDPDPGQAMQSLDLLGGSDGDAVGSFGGAQLVPERTNTGDPGHGPAIQLLDDVGHYQSRPLGVYGVQAAVCGAHLRELSATVDPAGETESVLDLGRSSRA